MKSTFISTAVPMLHATRTYRLFQPIYGGHTSIMLLHRIRESDRAFEINLELDVTPDFLDDYIIAKKRQGWRFISLDYLLDNWDECCRRRKNLVMTLDDGYRDNYQKAWPVFQKHQVPFTVYLSTSFPNGTANLWWYLLADVVRNNATITIERPKKIKLSTRNAHHAFSELRNLYLAQNADDQTAFLAFLKQNHTVRYRAEDDLIQWNELLEMSQDSLCTIGCHTVSHANLARLSEEHALREIADAKADTEKRLNISISHFSYPYGKRSQASLREAVLSQRTAFRSAVTTRIGNLFPGHREHLHLLPRIPLFEDGWRGKLTDLYQSGMYSALTHGFRRMVTD